MDLSKFHVIAVVSNPVRYESRYSLFKKFEEDVIRKGAQLWVIEMQTGARFHRISSDTKADHVQLWSSALPGELWHKENLINLGIHHLTREFPDWRYVAWVDADVRFEQGFLQETQEALQHWDVVQMFSDAVDLGPQGEMLSHHSGFMANYWFPERFPVKAKKPNDYYGASGQGHPGFAWAARRDALNKLGNLIDWGVLGSADRHMACALIGRVMDSCHGDMHPSYKKWLKIWQDRAERHIRRNAGFVTGTIRHDWHGRKADRGYASRWRVLVKHQFNPDTDIKRDVGGVWQLVSETPRQINLRDDMRRYFRARREDATTTS